MRRLKIKFTKNTEPVEFTNQHMVNHFIYALCLKDDKHFHDAKSDYSISTLNGGVVVDGKLEFPNGAYITVTSKNEVFINKVVMGALNNSDFGCGMKCESFDVISEKIYGGYNYFTTLSPIMMKQFISKKESKYIVFDDRTDLYNNSYLKKATDNTLERLVILSPEKYSAEITNRMKNKLMKINPELKLDGFNIELLPNKNDKIKRIAIHGVVNYASQCNVKITSNKEVAEMIYNLGLGQSTGSGFGSIHKTENFKMYRN